MWKSDRNWNIISVDNNTICPEWWYIPTELDWTILENKLFSWICAWSDIVREIWQPSNWIWYWCDWLWWLNNINKNEWNNLIQALRIPLSGYLHNDGITFLDRWRLGSLWSSTESSSNTIYWREIMYDKTKVANYELDKNRKYSVRCIKD